MSGIALTHSLCRECGLCEKAPPFNTLSMISNKKERHEAAAPGRLLFGRFPLPRKGHGTPPKRSSGAQNRPSESPSVVPREVLE
jgi:Fe-S-cluster-containing hydrogenase component 2